MTSYIGEDMESIALNEAKAKLSEVISNTEKGRCYLITKNGKPVAELKPYSVNNISSNQAVDEILKLQDKVFDEVYDDEIVEKLMSEGKTNHDCY